MAGLARAANYSYGSGSVAILARGSARSFNVSVVIYKDRIVVTTNVGYNHITKITITYLLTP